MTPDKISQSKIVSQSKSYSLKTYITFIIPSLLGIFLFMVPIHYNNEYSIPIAFFSKWFIEALGDRGKFSISSMIFFVTIFSAFYRIYQPYLILRYEFLHRLLYPSLPWFIIRTIGGILVAMTLLQIGPEFIWGSKSGNMMREVVLPSLLGVFIFAGLFLPLLLNFGLLEFFGALLEKIMRPAFKLPGRSAVDCLASWLGDSTVGILMTHQQYKDKKYTQKEAAIIATTFSAVSITFCLFVITYVGLESLFLPFYLTICASGLIAAVVLPHLPPLRYKKDRYIDGSIPSNTIQNLTADNTLSWAYSQALTKAEGITSFKKIILDTCKSIVEMLFVFLPIIMTFGTLSLIIAEYTPLFTILSKPFMYYLDFLGVPESMLASEAIASGFSNMVQPAFKAAAIDNIETRFIIAAVSVSQLIYMIEVGALVLGSKIPINIFELFMIFILRTLITLPVIVGISHLIF